MKKKILLFVLSMACLAALLGVVFVANADETPETIIAGHNLSLDDSVQIIYYVKQTAPEGAEVGVLCWFDPQESYTLENAQYKLKQNGIFVYKGTELAQYNFPYIAAKMYTQDVYAVSYVKMGEEVIYGNLDKYSVLQYCQNKKNSGSALGNLVDQILDYGAAAQIYFNFNTDRLANADYYQISVKNGVLADGTTEGLFVSGGTAVLTANMTAEEGYEIIWKNSADEIVGEGETLTVLAEGNESYTASVIALEHTYGEWIVDKEATCTAAGSRHKTCTDCGDTITEEIPATGHSFGEWQAVTAQSCTSGGIEVRTCATCGTYEQRTYPAPGHQFGDWTVTKEVTCTENGERTRTCAVCGVLQRETIYAQGHRYGDWVTVKPATCEKGVQERTCAVCGNVEKKILPADYTLHIWGEDSCTVCGEHKASEGLVYELNDTVAIVGYTGNDTTVYLPSSYYGIVVTAIKTEAFKDQTQITEIVIPESITSVDSTAFSGCTHIQSATMPTTAIWAIPKDKLQTVVLNGGTNIREQAFDNCSSLASVTIGDSVTSIGKNAFYGCTSLTSVAFGEISQLTIIGEQAFYSCSSLVNITIPGSVTYIEKSAFSRCTSLTSVTIPDSVTSIGNSAFSGCTSLTSVTIPDSVTSIGMYAFSDCTSLTSVTIPDSVTSIGESAFWDCKSLTSVTFGENSRLMSIRSNAFRNCTSLTSVYISNLTKWCAVSFHSEFANPLNYAHNLYLNGELVTDLVIPDSVTSIGNYAFRECTSLTSVTIPNSVTSIGKDAFYNCTKLTSVYITDLAKWCAISFGNSYANPLYFAQNLYLNGELVTDLVIPENVMSIGAYAFYVCKSLISVTIPDSVTSIGKYAFRGCTSLTSVKIPDSVTSIGEYTFSGCTSLTSVTIPDSVTSIGYAAFSSCTSLTNVTIPDSVTSIGEYAFSGCTSLTSVTIGNSVTSIGNYAFYGCKSLISVTIPDSVKNIGSSAFDNCPIETAAIRANAVFCIPKGNLKTVVITSGDSISNRAFYNCSSLVSVTIPDSVTSIGDYTFSGCALTSVTIPDSVTSIGKYAFRGCTSLTSVKIPDSVTSIGEYTFSGCTSLTSVTIPDSVTSIGYAAFSSCTSLTSVTIGNGVTSIGNYAFSGCKSLTSVTIGNSVTSIGEWAFYDCTALSEIIFLGTEEEWNAISKRNYWNYGTGNYVIYCIDGNIAK